MIGNIVKFNSRKGEIQGPVINTKWSRRGQKAARNLNASLRLRGMDKAQVPEGQSVLEVADLKNEQIWTVSAINCKKVRKASNKQMIAGEQLKRSIVQGNARAKAESRNKNYEKSEDKGLHSLQPGDQIEVQYRGGIWRKETFSHFTSSGKVGIKNAYTKTGLRYVWPDFVRKAS